MPRWYRHNLVTLLSPTHGAAFLQRFLGTEPALG